VSSWLALTGGAAIVVSSYDVVAKGSSRLRVQGAEAWEVVEVAGRVRDMARYQQVAGAMVLAAVDSGEILGDIWPNDSLKLFLILLVSLS